MWYKELICNCKAKKTKVVAKLVTTYGQTVYGVNVESSCHSLSICAERAAIVNAVTNLGPYFKIQRMEVYAEKMGEPIEIIPCGSCRQLISEFAVEETTVCDVNIRFWMPNPYL